MAAPSFLTDTGLRLILLGGKGGVGKTTCAVAAALHLSRRDGARPVTLVSTDPAHSLDHSLAGAALPDNLTVVALDAAGALAQFKQENRDKLHEIARRGTFLDDEDISRFLDLSLPGLDELMALLELLRQTGDAERVVVVDTAPTGHTLRLLDTPAMMHRWLNVVDSLLGKHRYMKQVFAGSYEQDELDHFLLDLDTELKRLEALLRDPARCRFVPVTVPGQVVAEETRDLLGELDRLGIPSAEVIINRLALDGTCPACQERGREQAEQLAALCPDLGGRATWSLPALPGEVRGADSLDRLWDHCRPLDLSPPLDRQADIAEPLPRVDHPPPLPAPERRLLLFGGKGGVGKTTLAAATALRLAADGRRVLLLSADPAHSLADCLDLPLGPEPMEVAPNLRAMELDSEAELQELQEQYEKELEAFLEALSANMDLAFDREVMERIIDLSPPGLDELMAVLRATELIQQDPDLLLVLDAAPTGHLLRLLETPELVAGWIKAFFRLFLKYKTVFRLPRLAQRLVRLDKELKALRALLADPAQASLYAVAIPTHMGLLETADLLAACRRLGLSAPVLYVNLCTPGGAGCAACAANATAEHDTLAAYPAVTGSAHTAMVYRGPAPVGLRKLKDLGKSMYSG